MGHTVPGADNSAPQGTDPTRWAVWWLQGAGMILSPTWLLAVPETCPGVTPRRGGTSLPQHDPALATVLPREQFLGLSRRQGGRRRLVVLQHTPRPARP